jgi:hypothetical protein
MIDEAPSTVNIGQGKRAKKVHVHQSQGSKSKL